MDFKYKTGVYIGRFQPVHGGHLETIKIMLERCENIIISIGSHNRPSTIKNPWSSLERTDMIKKALLEIYNPECLGTEWTDYPKESILNRVKFQYVRDYMYNDNKWAAEVYSKALTNGATSDKTTSLFGHFKDDSSYYLNMFPQWSLAAVNNFYDLDSTMIRKSLFELKHICYTMQEITKKQIEEWKSTPIGKTLRDEYNFIKDYQKPYESLPFKPVFVTVDAIVIKSGHILLIKRGHNPGKGLYALPGGFLNHNEKIETAVLRELKEETKIDVPNIVLESLLKEMTVFDHPRRSQRGRSITHAGLIDLGVGALPNVKGSDDAVGAEWVPIADFYNMENQLFEDHYDIITQMISKY